MPREPLLRRGRDAWLRLPRATRLILPFILLVASLLRIPKLGDLPAGMFCDEAALGYNAWAVLHHGVDENGTRFPLFLWSFTGYKNPVYMYAAMLPIGLFGLSEFSLRLTSALFGLGTILAVYFLGRRLLGEAGGLWAAALLAVCPWHLHFSRIAFELISFPLLFTVGLIFLVRFTRGDKTLSWGLFFLASCFYAYAIAKLFVPLFIVGFVLLYVETIWRRFREWVKGTLVFFATVAPVVVFDLQHRERGGAYFRNNSILRDGASLPDLAMAFAASYREFFSKEFLFQKGDGMFRHAVQGHGELYPFFLPLLLLGALALLLRRNRESKLVLLWLLVYPAGASLMNEVPSASRGFIGATAFCLTAAAGLAAVLAGLAWIKPPMLGRVLAAAASLAVALVATKATARYLDLYVNDYPRYSAAGLGGFQYGYRDLIARMEPHRHEYQRLMMTATDVNMPYIFCLFYNRVDPREYAKTGEPGYLILDPTEYARYDPSPERPILYGMRDNDLIYFSDYDVKGRVITPAQKVEFTIIEARRRKRFLSEWLVLGLFPNPEGSGISREEVDVSTITRRLYPGKDGPVSWREYTPSMMRTDLQFSFAHDDKEHPNEPTDVCAYALTTLEVEKAQPAVLELLGTPNPTRVFLNGRIISPPDLVLEEKMKTRPVELQAGGNTLVLKTCKGGGGWWFLARIANPDGSDIPGLAVRAELPPETSPPVPASRPGAQVQLVEGFASIQAFRHTDTYPDYRGGTTSWWSYKRDESPNVSWTTAPCPKKAPTAAAFTASMGEEVGRAELWVDGTYALTFDLGADFSRRSWKRGIYRLDFVRRQVVSGSSGLFVLFVHESGITAGKPLELRVVPQGPGEHAWFMMKAYTDTIAHEELTPLKLAALDEPEWADTKAP